MNTSTLRNIQVTHLIVFFILLFAACVLFAMHCHHLI